MAKAENKEEIKIFLYGDSVLRKECKPVKDGDPQLRETLNRMARKMYDRSGIGLAAPQVGISQRFVICDVDWFNDENGKKPKRRLHVLINPEIVEESTEDGPFVEGCLSIPGVEGEVFRPLEVTVKYQDLHFRWRTRKYTGLLARVVQHELDHLDGKLFVDRMSFVKRKMLAGALNRIKQQKVAYDSSSVNL